MEEALYSSHYLSYNRRNRHDTPSLELSTTHKWKAYRPWLNFKNHFLIPSLLFLQLSWLICIQDPSSKFYFHYMGLIFALTHGVTFAYSPSGEHPLILQDLAKVFSTLWGYIYFVRLTPLQPEGLFSFSSILLKFFAYTSILGASQALTNQNGHQLFIWNRILEDPWWSVKSERHWETKVGKSSEGWN